MISSHIYQVRWQQGDEFVNTPVRHGFVEPRANNVSECSVLLKRCREALYGVLALPVLTSKIPPLLRASPALTFRLQALAQRKRARKKEREAAARLRSRVAMGMENTAVDLPAEEGVFSLASIKVLFQLSLSVSVSLGGIPSRARVSFDVQHRNLLLHVCGEC